MRMRVVTARSLLALGRFIQSLAIMVMKPDDLVEFSRQAWADPWNIHIWTEWPAPD